MSRAALVSTLSVIALSCAWSYRADAMCGGGGGGGSNYPTVKWDSSEESARSAAAAKTQAYAIYFCSEEVATYAGEGKTGHDAYLKANRNKPGLPTPFDQTAVVSQLKKAEIEHCVKVVLNKSNESLIKKYGGSMNTLVICAPSGEALLRLEGQSCCQSGVTASLKDLGGYMTAWQKNHKSPAVTESTR